MGPLAYARMDQRRSQTEPDAFRLEYRGELTEVVRHAVREKIRPNEAALAQPAKSMVSPEVLDHFTSIALAELTELHEGNIARFRLRPSEFHASVRSRISASIRL